MDLSRPFRSRILMQAFEVSRVEPSVGFDLKPFSMLHQKALSRRLHCEGGIVEAYC